MVLLAQLLRKVSWPLGKRSRVYGVIIHSSGKSDLGQSAESAGRTAAIFRVSMFAAIENT